MCREISSQRIYLSLDRSETCAFSSEIADCVAVSGVHKKWCIGCKVELNAPHKGAVAFRMQDDQDGNYLS